MSNDAIPQTALEAESFLRHALKHIGDGLIFYRMPRARAAACTVIREAISQMQEQQHDEQLVERWMCSFDTTEEDIREFAKFVSMSLRP